MQIALTWKNRNTDDLGTDIYRSESPIDPNNLPEPIATVGPGVTEFTDTDVERNKLYYYRFRVYSERDSVLSDDKAISAMPFSGPGPNKPVAGDYDLGYFGKVSPEEMFTAAELRLVLDFDVGITSDSAYTPYWMKFARKGKILYFPNRAIATSLSWQDLYNAGLVYGIDGPGESLGLDPVNQLRIVSKEGVNFKVRLPNSHPTGDYLLDTPEGGNNNEPRFTYHSEWDDLIYRINSAGEVDEGRGRRWDNLGPSDFRASGHNSHHYQTHNQNFDSNGNTIFRSVYTSSSSGYSPVYLYSKDNQHASLLGWRPVLELIL